MLKTKALEDVDNPIICHVLKLTINLDFPRETNINKYMLNSIIFLSCRVALEYRDASVAETPIKIWVLLHLRQCTAVSKITEICMYQWTLNKKLEREKKT